MRAYVCVCVGGGGGCASVRARARMCVCVCVCYSLILHFIILSQVLKACRATVNNRKRKTYDTKHDIVILVNGNKLRARKLGPVFQHTSTMSVITRYA